MTFAPPDLSRWLGGLAVGMLSILIGLIAGIDPKLAIAASFGVAFMIIVIADLLAGLMLFVFLAFLEIVPFGASSVGFSKLLGGLLFVSWALVMTSTRRVPIQNEYTRTLAFILGGFLGWVTLSAIWAEVPADAISTVQRYLLNAGFFVIVATTIRDRRDAGLLMGAFAAGAFIAAVYGLMSPGRFESEFGRLESAALDPNELSAVLVPAVAICMFTALGLRRPLLQLTALAVGSVCGLTILMTVSRGGLIALFVMLVVAIIAGGRWRGQMLLIAATIAAGGFIYFAAFAPPSAVEHLQSTTQGDARFAEGRYTIWQIAWRMVEDNPVLGVGGGNFATESRNYLLEPGAAPRSDLIINRDIIVHNTYLETAVEYGVIGISLFLGLIVACYAALIKAVRTFKRNGDREMELLSRALLAAIAGILVADIFISEQFSKALWLLLAMGPAMLSVSRNPVQRG
jgi:putative inorganic carbon (HCO3(-)) transporter